MGKERTKEEVYLCPVGRFFAELEESSQGKAKFFQHMNQSRVEFLKAFRSLLDERIDGLEKRQEARSEKKATRIKVE